MDEARTVLERLARIDDLQRAGADPRTLLRELRALLAEAEAWARAEPGGAGAQPALARCEAALEAGRTLLA